MEKPGASALSASTDSDYYGERKTSLRGSFVEGRDELDQPQDVKISGVFNPFPEAVVKEPVITGRRLDAVPDVERRRSSVANVRMGTFSNASDDSFYKPIDAYEGRHRYDPDFSWTKNEEKRLVRKLDWKICTWACLMFFALQLDRGNIVQALSDGMLGNLNMNSNQSVYELPRTSDVSANHPVSC